MACTPSVARAAAEATLASCIPSAKMDLSVQVGSRNLLDPLLFLGFLLPALLLHLPLALLLPLDLREEDVVDVHVHLRHPEAHQALHPVGHVASHGLGDLGDGLVVLDCHRQVDGRLFLADLDRDALGLARAAAHAGDAAEEAARGLRSAAAHPDAVYLSSSYASDLGDRGILDDGIAPLGLKRASAGAPLLFAPLLGHVLSFRQSLAPSHSPTGYQPVDGQQ